MVPSFQTPESPPLWRHLARQLREWIHPVPPPRLQLDSTPIPVKDIWSHEHQIGRRVGSLAIHAAILALIAFPFWHSVHIPAKHEQVTLMPVIYYPGPSLPRMHRLAGGGSPVHLPSPPKLLSNAVSTPPVSAPLLLTPSPAQANVPLPQLASLGPIAGPPGSSFGHSGPGPGGPGIDAAGGGDCVRGPCVPGGDISQPRLIFDPQPEYSNAARRAKFQGTVVVQVIIGADGHVYQPKVIQHLGLGLDQKALAAVARWRFDPALRNGHPVRVLADIQVNFRLY